jgi:Ca-activated chloride channel family protein
VAREARAAGVPVSTVALGTPDGSLQLPDGRVQQVPPDPESLREIAQASGGRAYTAEDAGALEDVYEDLGSRIGTRPEQREITAGVAGAGVLLLLGALGTAWRRRGILA